MMDTELRKPSTLNHERTLYVPSTAQIHLTVPGQPLYVVDDELPIDQYGLSLRNNSSSDLRLRRKSSCYSRNTDGDSVHEYEDTKEQEYHIDDDVQGIARPALAHLLVPSGRYTTRHGNESKLIFQGLSDPYRSGISSMSDQSPCDIPDNGKEDFNTEFGNLQPVYPLQLTRTQTPLPSPRTHNWLARESNTSLPKSNPRFAKPSVPPIRPERWSAVSPSFRTPTSLVSPFKMPPSIVISSTSQLGQYSINSSSSYTSLRTQEYPPKKDIILIVLAVVLATFCTALDRGMISTAILTITSQFNTIEDIGWYSTSYLLTACSAHLFYSKLYRLYTRKWIYISALLIFELGSLISGVAKASGTLIFGRALAGLGASGVLGGGVLMLRQCVRVGQVSDYFGVFSGAVLVVGPVLGGVLTQYASWRLCFFINLPFTLSSCILLLISSWNAPRITTAKTTFKGKLPFLDLEGTLLFLPCILCLLLAMQWGGVKYPWSSASIIVLFVVFVVTMIGFVLVQKYKGESASIPPRIFMNRNVYGGTIFSFFSGGSIAVMLYYLPLWFQVTKNASPSKSGAMLLPLVLSMAATSLASGILVNIIEYYTPLLIFASVMMSIGSGLLTTLQATTTTSAWIGYQIIFGIGAGSGMHQTLFAIQSSFQRSRDVASCAALMIFAQILGADVAIGMSQSVLENKLVNGILAAGLNGVSFRLVLHTGATDSNNVLSGENLGTVLGCYTHAIDQAFVVSVGLAAASIIGALAMDWNRVRGRRVPLAFL